MESKIIIGLILILHATTPYAVKFHSYINEKGETVFSNIPKKCIQKSTLTCLQYHPLMFTGDKKSNTSGKAKSYLKQSGQKTKHSEYSRPEKIDNSNDSYDTSFDILNNIVEMNNLMNEYYPAESDPVEANKVRQQQEDILDVLQVIKGVSSEGEKSSIDRAINILRNNLID